MLEFVNCFLSLLSSSVRGRTEDENLLLLNPETGFPTRKGFYELVRHELAGEHGNSTRAAVMLMRLDDPSDLILSSSRLRRALREGDVVAPLHSRLLGAVLYCPEADLPVARRRITEKFLSTPAMPGTKVVGLAVQPLPPKTDSRRIWKMLFSQLREHAPEAR